jgi:hypothetical protein
MNNLGPQTANDITQLAASSTMEERTTENIWNGRRNLRFINIAIYIYLTANWRQK